ncbi:MAG: hypothetical protein J6L61_01195 [Ruminiclostridium sp.]|nr:hypothetical protein [Ruminiclostridium sp.]
MSGGIFLNDRQQVLTLTDRRALCVNGVLEIISYDSECIVLYTVLGDMRIKGSELEIGSAFTENGNIEISGNICSLNFSNNRTKYADNFISRIFR